MNESDTSPVPYTLDPPASRAQRPLCDRWRELVREHSCCGVGLVATWLVRDPMRFLGRLIRSCTLPSEFSKLRLKRGDLLFGGILQVGEHVTCLARADELVQLEMNGLRVSVLRRLNDEDHQKGHHGRAGVDDKLPRVAEMKDRTRDYPEDDDRDRCEERPMAPKFFGCPRCKVSKLVGN